jgi:hypothetical protein
MVNYLTKGRLQKLQQKVFNSNPIKCINICWKASLSDHSILQLKYVLMECKVKSNNWYPQFLDFA